MSFCSSAYATDREQALQPEASAIARVRALNQQVEQLRAMGKSEAALRTAKEVRQLAEQLLPADDLDRAVALNNLGVIFFERGDYRSAKDLHEQALAIRRKQLTATAPDIAQSLNNLGAVYRAGKDYRQAERCLREALEIYETSQGRESPAVATSLNNLAALAYIKGESEKASTLYEQALAIRKKILLPTHPDLAQSFNNLGLLYNRQGAYDRAAPLLHSALAIYQQVLGPEHPAVAVALHNLALLYDAQGNSAQAVNLLLRVADIREQHLNLVLNGGTEEQKLAYITMLSGDIDAAVSVHIRTAPGNLDALRLAFMTVLRRKGRVLDAMTDTVATLRRRLAPEDQQLLDQLAAARSRLAALLLRTPQTRAAESDQAQLAAQKKQVQDLEERLGNHSTEFRQETRPVTLPTVQSALPAEATLVEFVAYRPFTPQAARQEDRWGARRYAAYLLRHTGDPRWCDLGEAATIDHTIAEWREALTSKDVQKSRDLGRLLDEQLMRPIRKQLSEASFFLLSPDDTLHLLPFGALMDENGQYLLERYTFVYVSSGRDLQRLKHRVPARDDMVIVANPAFGDGGDALVMSAATERSEQSATRSLNVSRLRFLPLQGTAEEAHALQRILPQGRILSGEAATEAAVKKLTGPRLLHVATHGFFLPGNGEVALPRRGGEVRIKQEGLERQYALGLTNPLLRSGLAFAGANRRKSEDDDGVLTALEAAGLDLWGTKLVTLSACETGVGDVRSGEGVYGLRRAMIMAGAESQVMSLWKVADAATRDLMVDYYKRLLHGAGRAEGLRQAQLAMLHGKAHGHPFYWASFIVSGDWTPIDGL